MMVTIVALVILLVTTLVLWLLETVSEFVDLCCKDPDFFFSSEEATLLVAMCSLEEMVGNLRHSREGDKRQRSPTECAKNL